VKNVVSSIFDPIKIEIYTRGVVHQFGKIYVHKFFTIYQFIVYKSYFYAKLYFPDYVMSTSSILICLSGKRKSGKDFVAQKFSQFLNEHGLPVSLCSISNPLKAEFADLNDLDLERLKSDSNYKESVRKEMVAYGSQVRVEDPAYFCRWFLLIYLKV
jgi:hypothetical protein